MARPWRIEYEGALYHILSRGNQRQDIFLNDVDRNIFLEAIGEMSSRFDIDIYAYVLMNNHYHLLLKTHHANISKAMQWFGTTYTRRFNTRHNRVGHLFQGRYKSFIVENDAYLTQLSCYIHRNPLRGNITQRLAKYPWSSYPTYAYKKEPPEWLKTGLILSQFAIEDPHHAYRKKVQNYAGEEESLLEDLRYGLFLGTHRFADKLRKQFVETSPPPELSQQVKLLKDADARTLVKNISRALDCRIDDFKTSLRISKAEKMDRDLMLYCLWQSGIFTNQRIGELFGLSYSSVSKRAAVMKKCLEKDETLLKKFHKINALIKV